MPKVEAQLERCRVDGRFEIKVTQAAEDGTFTGYGSVFDNEHETSAYQLPPGWNDVMAPGAFTKTLAEHKKRGTLPVMFCQHDMFALPIGAYTEMKQDDKGLYVEGKLALKVSRASDVYELMKIGAMRGLSIGFKPTKFSLDQEAKLRTIQEVDLWEISPVTIPADSMAVVSDVKGGGRFPSIREFEAFLRDVGGCSRKEAKAIAAGGFKAVSPQRDVEGDADDEVCLTAALETAVDDRMAKSRVEAESRAQEPKNLIDSIGNAMNERRSQRDAESELGTILESIEKLTSKK